MQAPVQITVTLKFEKATKNTYKYSSDNQALPLREVYLQKSAVGPVPPTHVQVQVSA